MARTKKWLMAIVRFIHLNFGGLAVGVVFYFLSLTPSLLPRPATYQGAISGISFCVGYAVGVFVSWILRRIIKRELPKRVKEVAWAVLLGGTVVLDIVFGFKAAAWQNEVHVLVGEQPVDGTHITTIFLVSVLTITIVLGLARLIYRFMRLTGKVLDHWLPRAIASLAGIVVVSLLAVWLYNGVLYTGFVRISNDIYRKKNDTTNANVTQPTSLNRSGSTASLVPWQTLGRQGRNFVAGGPSAEQLASVNAKTANDPIRIYVGLESANNPEARANLAVQELERTGAFNRPVLCVMTATGTGWIEPQSADSLEYMYDGNTALVSIQYSYLPSWISFLVDQQNAADAGRALFNAVYAKWATLPVDHRPKLVAYGLSLGSYGSQIAFSGVDDFKNRVDGALFIGSPNNSYPWRYFTRQRDAGTPEWQPVYQDGATVRFAASSADLAKPLPSAWTQPHILYLQHASDSVVWWSPDLLLKQPAWLREPRGPDVSPDMHWYPFITFSQVSIDQFFGTTVPNGHGHNYANMIVDAWAAVAAPADFTPQKAVQIQNIINAYPNI